MAFRHRLVLRWAKQMGAEGLLKNPPLSSYWDELYHPEIQKFLNS
jgi:hypothetical protein